MDYDYIAWSHWRVLDQYQPHQRQLHRDALLASGAT